MRPHIDNKTQKKNHLSQSDDTVLTLLKHLLLYCDFERESFRHHKIIIIIMTGNNNLLRESNTNTTHERRRRRSGGGVFDDDVNDDDDASKRVSQHRKATLAAAEKVRRFGRLLCARFFHRWGCFPSLSLSL